MATCTASNNPSLQEALLITMFIAGPYKSAAIKFVFDDSTMPTRYSNKRQLQLLPDSIDNSGSESRCFEFAYLVKLPLDLQILVQFGKESISCLRETLRPLCQFPHLRLRAKHLDYCKSIVFRVLIRVENRFNCKHLCAYTLKFCVL